MPDKKINFNLSMPAPIVKEYQRMAGFVGEREKWLIGAAAIIELSKLSDDQIKDRIAEVAGAEVVGKTGELVRKKKKGKR